MTDSTSNFRPTSPFLAPLNQFGQAVLEFLRTVDAARACAAAVENRFQPKAEDLRMLGIEPKTFATIRL